MGQALVDLGSNPADLPSAGPPPATIGLVREKWRTATTDPKPVMQAIKKLQENLFRDNYGKHNVLAVGNGFPWLEDTLRVVAREQVEGQAVAHGRPQQVEERLADAVLHGPRAVVGSELEPPAPQLAPDDPRGGGRGVAVGRRLSAGHESSGAVNRRSRYSISPIGRLRGPTNCRLSARRFSECAAESQPSP
jgi:hypothetical protein